MSQNDRLDEIINNSSTHELEELLIAHTALREQYRKNYIWSADFVDRLSTEIEERNNA